MITHIFIPYYLPDTVLNALYIFIQLTYPLKKPCKIRSIIISYFTDDESEAQKG